MSNLPYLQHALGNQATQQWLSHQTSHTLDDDEGGSVAETFATAVGRAVGAVGGAIGSLAGAIAGAVTGAIASKTVTVNITVLDGATDNSARDIRASNAIYSTTGCALRVTAGNKQTLTAKQTSTILGSDKLLKEPSGATASNEERALVAHNRTPGRLTCYYAPGFKPSKRGTSLQKPRHGVADSLLMANTAAVDTFPHELGHILARDPSHSTDPDNLMAGGGIRRVGVDKITAAQCSAFRTTTSYPS